MVMNKNVKNALSIGFLCSVSYLAVYVARNLLGVVTPQMIESGRFTIEYIGSISTGYMLFYACGQLINGAIGDKIIARYMISMGLIGAGICNFCLPYAQSLLMNTILYSLSGFFLSMVYGPLTKVVSENVLPKYASRCALGYTCASFLGSPGAGVLAMALNWQAAFKVCGLILIAMGAVCFLLFLLLEKKKIIQYNQYQAKKSADKNGIKILIEHEIVKFTFVSILTGIVRTTVVFWVPTYLTQYVGFDSNTAVALFTVVTLSTSLAPYINNLLIYERVFKRNRNRTLTYMFSASAVCFLMLFFWKQPAVNVIFLVLALMTNGGAATMLWSVYCPSLRDTGMVSTATGFLDFVSYVAAAVANLLFSNAVAVIGWTWLIVVWCAIMCVGIIVSLQKRPVQMN